MEQEFDIYSLIRKNLLFLCLAGAGLIFIIVGIFIAFSQSQSKNQLDFQAGSESSSASSSASFSSAKIVVDIEGAVMKPGIYTLPDGSRTHDLIVACGGLSASADRDWFAKNLNQAAKLVDGQKIYIPRVGEETLSPATSTSNSVSSDSTASIGINSGSLTDLDSLPGIGPVTAQKIVDNRPYSTINDLLSKKVVSSSEFDKIKNQISTN